MWLNILFIILPIISVLFFLMSIYGHKLEIKRLNKKIDALESERSYNNYKFTKLDPTNNLKK